MATFPIQRTERAPSRGGIGVEIPLGFARMQAQTGEILGDALVRAGAVGMEEAQKWNRLDADLKFSAAKKQAAERINSFADALEGEDDPDQYWTMHEQAVDDLRSFRPAGKLAARAYDLWLNETEPNLSRATARAMQTKVKQKADQDVAVRVRGYQDAAAAMAAYDLDQGAEYLDVQLPNVPEEDRQKYLDVGNHGIAVAALDQDPTRTGAWLEAHPERYTPEVRVALVREAKRLQEQRAADFQVDTWEQARQLSVGIPEQKVPGRPQEALKLLKDSLPQIRRDQHEQFLHRGLNDITVAIMNRSAQDALDFLNEHQSEYDPGDWAALAGRAEEAIRRQGGSTSIQGMRAQTDILRSINNPTEYAQKVAQYTDVLTPQAHWEMARRFAMRDDLVLTPNDAKVPEMLLRVGDYYITHDEYSAQRELATARFGEVRNPGDAGGLDIFGIKPEAPAISKEDHMKLQALLTAKIPQNMGIAAREGLRALQDAIVSPGGTWTRETSDAAMQASIALISRMETNPKEFATPEDAYKVGVNLGLAAKPVPAVAPTNGSQSKETPVEQIKAGLKAGLAAPSMRRSDAALLSFPTRPTTTGLQKFYGVLRTDEERAEARQLAQSGLSDEQVVEKMAPKMFQAEFWDIVKDSEAKRKAVEKALAQGVLPAAIMDSVRKGGK